LGRQRPKPTKGNQVRSCPKRFQQTTPFNSVIFYRSNYFQVAVSFLGLRCERAWIQDNSIVPFTVGSLGLESNSVGTKPTKDVGFTEKKFKTDKDFRAAVIEGIR
jgi:hypothetical protein